MKFHFKHHSRLFVIGRGLLRSILSRYLSLTPQHLRFRYGPNGKPALRNDRPTRLHFNLAHSGDWAVYAVTQANELGVDVERVCQLTEAQLIARRCFSVEEYADFLTVHTSQQPIAFFKLLDPQGGISQGDRRRTVSTTRPISSIFATRTADDILEILARERRGISMESV